MDDPGSKATWRRRIREHRRARTTTPGAATARIADARTLADHVLARLGPGRDARGVPAIVAVYQSLPTEPPTTVLLHELLRRRRTVLLPVLLPDRDLSWRALGRARPRPPPPPSTPAPRPRPR
jgi:5-formyltetrahydrofolate cyclo-ligase